MEEEFDLSEKMIRWYMLHVIEVDDVKKFIKLIEKEVIVGNPHSRQMLIKLRKYAGSSLASQEIK